MKTYSLGSIINKYGGLIQTGPFGSQLHQYDYSQEGIPVVMPKDIKNGRIDENTVARIPERKAQELSRHCLKQGSIVFPRRGEISKCAYIEADQEGFLCGTGCIKIELPREVLSPRFFFYYLGLRHVVEWLERNAIGTTMLNLNTSIIGGIQIPDINIRRQIEIADVLSAYDELIEKNRRRIDLLEHAVRLLYKEWFVHFRFPGHEHVKINNGVPDGWEKAKIKDYFDLLGGFAFKSQIYQESGKYGIVTIKNVHNAQFIPDCSAYIDEIPESMKEHCHLCTGDILLSLTGNIGRVCIIFGENFLLNQRVAKISPRKNIPKCYVYWTFNNEGMQRNLENLAYGVAQQNLSPVKVGELDFILPQSRILDLFESYVEATFNIICNLNLVNQNLKKSRDLLLPRLMNGEIAV
ncbi:putative type-1 restriction enzyme specificity protein [Pelotomaculum schinkii]|uniref:Putative type-1 restriction enzyme specificity protein n=1 Tax=Pelotomaculum schinkii TaxID=78350 RepID=A0A4Y7RIE2_9FIRM|nr:restriction endonuclease subunit S [Pelotomaculum schinkii]TEB08509.1 putative type-1 restriction enzyme specificity protein [Pelotomaculum schinkii]